jgi:single-stranded DNA-binding protein
MVTVNVVVLAGTVAADPVERRMPSGDEVSHMLSGTAVRE